MTSDGKGIEMEEISDKYLFIAHVSILFTTSSAKNYVV